MKLKFKIQDYQTQAVQAVVDCFKGQPKQDPFRYKLDPGIAKTVDQKQIALDESGFRNADILLSPNQLLQNIHAVQKEQNIPISESLIQDKIAHLHLDIEMETGTGKTYCYIKTMFELNKQYGWNKFIVVVPSIAIREGVKKSFEITADHFLESYHKRARFFIYSSKPSEIQNIESFSSDTSINVMIINVQAFNTRGKDARKIFDELDSFQSRRPIDVIKANQPILILDEPQKMEGKATLESLQEFNALMVLRYSATHKTNHNKIYRLDAIDAYNQKLVKKIAVRGISVNAIGGTQPYVYLESIEISSSNPPIARMEIQIKQKNGIQAVRRKLEKGINLYELTNLEQYKGYLLSDINALTDTVSFTNGIDIQTGEVLGDVSESLVRRLQIREAIKAHLEKEADLFTQGIKALSLFFIGKVDQYRMYDDQGQVSGEYAKIFEEEYQNLVEEMLSQTLNKAYHGYLSKIEASKTHNGYFSIDKKTKKLQDPSLKKKSEESDDVDAYDLILKDKEKLLSFEEPTRFIFSHSALREGWDNPNVFVICALKKSDNNTTRRQEVGRGMRLSVNKVGERMDHPQTVHNINVLTVIASESYKDYVTGLQSEITEAVSARPQVADEKYFTGKTLHADTKSIEVTPEMAKQIYRYLIKNDYTDEKDHISKKFIDDKQSGILAELPPELKPYQEEILKLIDSVLTPDKLPLPDNGRKPKLNPLNKNFDKKQFQDLWSQINQKAVYKVDFKTPELIEKCVKAINDQLQVSTLTYTIEMGKQAEQTTYESLKEGEAFLIEQTQTDKTDGWIKSSVKYDLIGKIAQETKLIRKTIGTILQTIDEEKFNLFAKNPEEFISKCSLLINEQKATTIIEHLTYDPISEKYDTDIFTQNQKQDLTNALANLKKHIYDYLIVDSNSKIETEFAKNLDTSAEVEVFAKLPRGFSIPTPVGDYNPDWAVCFKEGSVKHIYFIAETKGSMSSMELREIEKSKIACAKKFFQKITTNKVKYDMITTYAKLMELVQ